MAAQGQDINENVYTHKDIGQLREALESIKIEHDCEFCTMLYFLLVTLLVTLFSESPVFLMLSATFTLRVS